jgi:hypothetical protein
MGIHGLKPVLTYEVINAWDYLQCGRATKSRACVVDASNVLHMVAARHPAHTFTQDYTPALADWRRLLEGCHARNLDFTVVFDGAKRFAAEV